MDLWWYWQWYLSFSFILSCLPPFSECCMKILRPASCWKWTWPSVLRAPPTTTGLLADQLSHSLTFYNFDLDRLTTVLFWMSHDTSTEAMWLVRNYRVIMSENTSFVIYWSKIYRWTLHVLSELYIPVNTLEYCDPVSLITPKTRNILAVE